MARLAAMGLEVDLVDGWEGRIFRRDRTGLEETYPVMQVATFALPPDVADFGGGLPASMRATDVFAVLFEYGPESVGAPLFAAALAPRGLTGSDFHPYTLRRGVAGQSGTQRFFTEQQRPFTLYVVLGSHGLRERLVARVNRLLDRVTIHPAAAPSVARRAGPGR
jgi:hypothetical protein